MKKNTNEKSLIQFTENSVFYKMKNFFKNLFHKNEIYNIDIVEKENNIAEESVNKKNKFMEEIRKIEDEETKLLKLQKKYRRGEITEDELTDEQVDALCELYDKQIAALKKSNEMRKQRILEYRKRLQTEE